MELVTIRKARFWSNNKELIFVVPQLPHRMLQYEMWERINALYNTNNDFFVRNSLSLNRIPIFLETEVYTLLTCSFQLKLESIVSPKSDY